MIDQYTAAMFVPNWADVSSLYNLPENIIRINGEESFRWLQDTNNNATKYADLVRFFDKDFVTNNISDIKIHEKVESLLKES